MKKLNILPKIFIQTFSLIGAIIILIHLSVFFLFPKTYLDSRKVEIKNKADEISAKFKGKSPDYIKQTLEFYSDTGTVKAFIKDGNESDKIKIKNNVNIDLKSRNNSIIIEERAIKSKDGKKIYLQFVSTADMQKDAKDLSLKFLPYSLLISLLFSAVVSFVYAKSIKNNIKEIKDVTDKMMTLDKDTRLKVNSEDEVGQLKEQINDLYTTLLRTIDDLELKNQEILRLEKVKYDFFKGASHELKTPLASLKVILENMKYNIGKYKNRDMYLDDCIDIVDGLTGNISQILSVYAIENMKDDEETLNINDVLENVLRKYEILANQKQIQINNCLSDEKIYIGKPALNIILSNLISNAVKYSDAPATIDIKSDEDWLCIKNTCKGKHLLNTDKLTEAKFDFNSETGSGLGLYIVDNLLSNYKIQYKVLQNNDKFVFMIRLQH